MKLQYLYVDESYKKILKENKLINYNEIRKDNIFIFYFEQEGENEDSAKFLSSIDTVLSKCLDSKKYFKLNDEAGEYFNKILYPLCNKFERLLRQVLCICAMSKQEDKALKRCRKLESINLIDIYNTFFTDEIFSNQIKSILQERNLTHKDLVTYMFVPENTLWEKLFNKDYQEIPDNFIDIKFYRNSVMHTKNIDFFTFQKAKEKLKLVNDKLEDILDKLLSGSILIEDDSSKRLAKMIEEIENMNLSDKEAVDLMVKRILENNY